MTVTFPKGVELIQKHHNTHASVLKLYIILVDQKFVYKLYDKRNSYQIFLLSMLHIDSNVPSNIFYSALAGDKPV